MLYLTRLLSFQQSMYTLVAGVGTGILFQVLLIYNCIPADSNATTADLHRPSRCHAHERYADYHRRVHPRKVCLLSPSAIHVLTQCRTLGGTIGLAFGNTIISDQLRRRLGMIEGYHQIGNSPLTGDISGLATIEPLSLRQQVLHAYTRSIATVWYVWLLGRVLKS